MEVAHALWNLLHSIKCVVSSIDVELLNFNYRYVMQALYRGSFTVIEFDCLLVGDDGLSKLLPVEKDQAFEVDRFAVARIDF